MLLHNDIGICEDCAHELDQDDFKGCVVCELRSEIIKLRKEIKNLRIQAAKHSKIDKI